MNPSRIVEVACSAPGPCPQCEGQGRVTDLAPCPDCGGTGRVPDRAATAECEVRATGEVPSVTILAVVLDDGTEVEPRALPAAVIARICDRARDATGDVDWDAAAHEDVCERRADARRDGDYP